MALNIFDSTDLWRAIILYGLNTATYKIALGQCLAGFAAEDKTHVSMNELAQAFFDLYLDRLRGGKPQLVLPNRRTIMERIVDLYKAGKLTRTQAIEKVENAAFNDVVPRFHTVNNLAIPLKFYDHTTSGLVLADDLFKVFEEDKEGALTTELDSRWDLLEAAFEMRRDSETTSLSNDIRNFYLVRGYERTGITHLRPVLNGYQNGICFYCGEQMGEHDVHVDHVIPRQVLYHDEVWNLVLAHTFCNEQKSDALPSKHYIEKLINRNEFFIASNHPIKQELIKQMGSTIKERRQFVYRVYNDAKTVLGFTWEGIKGYNPETDLFYKTFVRTITQL